MQLNINSPVVRLQYEAGSIADTIIILLHAVRLEVVVKFSARLPTCVVKVLQMLDGLVVDRFGVACVQIPLLGKASKVHMLVVIHIWANLFL